MFVNIDRNFKKPTLNINPRYMQQALQLVSYKFTHLPSEQVSTVMPQTCILLLLLFVLHLLLENYLVVDLRTECKIVDKYQPTMKHMKQCIDHCSYTTRELNPMHGYKLM